jgi:purine-binding chemotaxis protein CheW
MTNTTLNKKEMVGMDKQYLFIFSIHNSLFAIDAMAVRETFGLPEIAPLEETPPYVVGVINLRGRIVPVIDLNIRFGRAPEKYHLTDGMIVVDVEGQAAGMIVNEVHDVITIRSENIDPPPFCSKEGELTTHFVVGEAKAGEDIIIILNHNRLLAQIEKDEATAARLEIQNGKFNSELQTPHSAFSDVSPEEKAIFRGRAVDLMNKTDEEDLSKLQPVVVVGLNGEYFGIDLKSVQEFSHITNLMPVPNCPEHVIGNMNLRGSILTVMDIRGCLGMLAGTFSRSAKVVITSVNDIFVGVAVDDIYDIAHLGLSDLSPLPASAGSVVEKYAKGTAHYGGRAMTVLNLPEIIKEGSLTVNEET